MNFLRRILVSPVIALLIAAPVTISATGCTTSASQVQQDGATIAQAIQQIAALETEQGNTALAQNLTTASQALEAATANYQTGSATAIIGDAATAVEVALAAIPTTAAYAPLVPIAVAAIDTLLSNIGTKTTTPAAAPAAAPSVFGAHAMVASPATRLVQIKANAPKIPHRILRSPEGDFKSAWNAQALKAGYPILQVK